MKQIENTFMLYVDSFREIDSKPCTSCECKYEHKCIECNQDISEFICSKLKGRCIECHDNYMTEYRF